MDEPGGKRSTFFVEMMLHTIEEAIAEVGASCVGDSGGNIGGLQRCHDGGHRKSREVGGGAGRRDGFSLRHISSVVGDGEVIDVDGDAFGSYPGTAPGFAQHDNNVRTMLYDGLERHIDRLEALDGKFEQFKLDALERLVAERTRGFLRCVNSLTAEGFEGGKKKFHGARQGMSMNLLVRDATEADLPRIVDIYNQSIPGGRSTADLTPITVADRLEWFAKFDAAKRPIWVAEDAGEVVACIYLTSFYGGRAAYDKTAEVSLYIDEKWQSRGVGTFLMQRMIDHCPALGVTTLIGMHFDHNEATLRLNEKFGFEVVGHLPEIAEVHGEKRGLLLSILRIPQAL